MKMATKTMADTSGAKRRKTTVDRLRLSDLPDALLVDVARYLSRPSAALFAVAVSTPQPQSATRKAIISSLGDDANGHWSVLDFGDTEKRLAKLLTDKDVQDVLSMIDAPNNLKTLKLTGCVNIDGSGLKSLTPSKVLQQIDLSSVGQHTKPGIELDPLISEEVVLPILDSIIQSSENKMKHIQLPKKWRRHFFGRTTTLSHQFLERYNQMLENRQQKCSKCESDCNEWSVPHVGFVGLHPGRLYGLQSHTCYVCTNSFCYQCDEVGAGGEVYRRSYLRYCEECERDYCIDCKPAGCSTCDTNDCLECMEKCDACGSVCCEGCRPFSRCRGSGCTKLHCDNCFDGKKYDIEYCDTCVKPYCSDCRYEKITDWGEDCEECKSSLVDVALAKQEETETENNQLRQEIEELRREGGTKHIEVENENKQLRQEIEELRQQNLILQEKCKSRS